MHVKVMRFALPNLMENTSIVSVYGHITGMIHDTCSDEQRHYFPRWSLLMAYTQPSWESPYRLCTWQSR